TFTVTRTGFTGGTATVAFATADGSATLADNDYLATSSTLTFNPGATSLPVTVLVNGDLTLEPDENFFVNLSNANGATISRGQGVGTILNDDAVFAINDVALLEGNSGTTAF